MILKLISYDLYSACSLSSQESIIKNNQECRSKKKERKTREWERKNYAMIMEERENITTMCLRWRQREKKKERDKAQKAMNGNKPEDGKSGTGEFKDTAQPKP